MTASPKRASQRRPLLALLLTCAATQSMATPTITGSDADDVLFGTPGNDVFDGGIGDDWMFGDDGDDEYHFSPGDGNDTIVNVDNSDQDRDVLVIHGIAPKDIWFAYDGDDLVISFRGSASSVRVEDWVKAPGNQLGEVRTDNYTITGENISKASEVMSLFEARVPTSTLPLLDFWKKH